MAARIGRVNYASAPNFPTAARPNLKHGVLQQALATLAHAYAVTGKPREARKILRDLRARSGRSYVSPASTAVVFGGLGDKETALEWLEIAYQQRDPGLHTLKVHPVFDTLRSEPHFRDLVRRMRLPQ